MLRNLSRSSLLCLLAGLIAIPTPDLGADETAAMARLRTPFTTSNVVGSPEPPHPYRVVRTLPKLKMKQALFVINEPGTKHLMFIEHGGSKSRVCRTRDDGTSGEFDVLLDVDHPVYSACFHPKFQKNGYIFLGSNGSRDGAPKQTRVTRYTIQREAPFQLDPKSARVIIEWDSNGHNGAAVVFGLDGMLYVTSGDGTSDSDTNITGQGLDHLLAKVLRIDVDRPDKDRMYSIPQDNPFVNRPGTRGETWAYGFRNPWRMCVDSKTGHIWVGNNGQDLWEQVYFVRKGDNYGWSVYEGGHPFYLTRKLGPDPHVKPAFDHPHSEARSLTGGVVYYGRRYPDLNGAYIYGDYSTGKIWAGRHDGTKVTQHREIADSTLQIAGFGLDAAGELLIVDYQTAGAFYTLEPTPKDKPLAEFPRKLSESGLFTSVADHVMQPGVVPYSVNAPLWSDNAFKHRFFAIPADAGKDGKPPKIAYSANGSWNFPDRTVLVKSFGLETEQGNAASRRWIETRFLTKTEGEWVGYSYAWNGDQTDATLVEKTGRKQEFVIRLPDGSERRQTWSYPSRSECMVCHSRAARFVLGLTTAQLNRSHHYGDFAANQLETLESLELINVGAKSQLGDAFKRAIRGEGIPDEEAEAVVDAKSLEVARGQSRFADVPRLADPYDKTETLELRVRSYLHANCAQCHVGAGGGNAQMKLAFNTSVDEMNVLDAEPLHDRYGITGARLVAPGAPDKSVLLHRLAQRGRGQMPQLATTIVDKAAVDLFRDWIRSLSK
ncbi:MAG: PQQ-dependent sugar dehydrogenase [Planctomycetota bacterium]|nr:PQQ-dependent sugar dehydrogenase [Planctomycetota bacterium]